MITNNLSKIIFKLLVIFSLLIISFSCGKLCSGCQDQNINPCFGCVRGAEFVDDKKSCTCKKDYFEMLYNGQYICQSCDQFNKLCQVCSAVQPITCVSCVPHSYQISSQICHCEKGYKQIYNDCLPSQQELQIKLNDENGYFKNLVTVIMAIGIGGFAFIGLIHLYIGYKMKKAIQRLNDKSSQGQSLLNSTN